MLKFHFARSFVIVLSLLPFLGFAEDQKISDAEIKKMQVQIQAMQTQIQQMQSAKSPEEQQRIMQTHMNSMHEYMQMMQNCPGCMGMMPDHMMDGCMGWKPKTQ